MRIRTLLLALLLSVPLLAQTSVKHGTGAPSSSDCNKAAHYGRKYADVSVAPPTNYTCGSGGWSAASAGVSSVAVAGPSWLTWTVSNPTSTVSASADATTGQTSHQVIGTCGTATVFGPCSLQAADIPSLSGSYLTNGSDVQSATGKTIDGVTPTVFGYLDPTSSVQTQLNGKAAANASTTVNGQTCALGSTCTVASYSLPAQYQTKSCVIAIGDPGAASSVLTDDNDSPVSCTNDSGSDWTITTVACWANAGSPTVTPILTGGSGTSMLTGALTCGTVAWAAGTVQGSAPVVHSFSGTGATCSSTPCSIDVNLTTAGGTAKYVVIKITGTY